MSNYHFKPFFHDFLGHLLWFCRQAFPQEHGLAVGKPKQVGEHPILGAECVLFTDIAVNQQPDFFRQVQFFQPAGIFVRLTDDFLILPATVCDAVHDAIHANAHELAQCRFFSHQITPFVVLYLASEPED